MVKVRHMKAHPQGLLKLIEDMQQADRVRAAGDTNQQDLFVLEQALSLNELQNLLFQVTHGSSQPPEVCFCGTPLYPLFSKWQVSLKSTREAPRSPKLRMLIEATLSRNLLKLERPIPNALEIMLKIAKL